MMGPIMEHGSPSRTPDSTSPGPRLVQVVLLAATSGALDALGFLALGGVFASVMTGNLVLLGLSGGTRNGSLAVHALVAVTGYVVGVAGATRAGGGPGDDPRGWTRRLHMIALVELGLVVAFSVGWELVRTRSSHPAQLVLVALAAVAMGVQSALMRMSTGSTVSTTYLTGTLTGVVATLSGSGSGSGVRDHDWGAVAVLAAAVVGAAAAGLVLTERSSLAPLVPLVALVGVLVTARPLLRPTSG